MNNKENIPSELQGQIEEILSKVDELSNPEAILYCGNEIMKKVGKEKGSRDVNDYSSFIPAY